MDLKEFTGHFAEQFDDTDEELIGADTAYKALDEWSSLVALSVIAMVDDVYEVEIGAREIMKCELVRDLYEVVKSFK